jgi:molybdopterin molybdotransferase
MITFEQALKTILDNAAAASPKTVKIEDSVGLILREDVRSALAMPPFDKSAVDGYAVRVSDLAGAPKELKCAGLIQAGDASRREVRKNECVKIMTGAPMPARADGVVMVEDTDRRGNFVTFLKTVGKGDNLCLRGEDIRRGQVILSRGTEISSSHIAVLAASGRSSVKAIARPTVAILNTGGEIVPPGARLAKGRIYNSNGPMLEALLKADGITPLPVRIVKDSVSALKAAIKKNLKADIVLISGGVSMGDYDLVPAVLRGLGVRGIFHKVKMKPGKPLFFGKKGGTLVFGIPGNPVSNFLAYRVFIRPAILKMSGCADYAPEFKSGVSGNCFRPDPNRRHFALVKIAGREGLPRLTAISNNGSADILALARSDGFMMVEEGKTVKKNEKMRFITWKPK